MRNTIFLLLLIACTSKPITKDALLPVIKQPHPFSYDLGVSLIPAKKADAPVMICCHGYGYNNRVAADVGTVPAVCEHLIGFNFPDYGCTKRPGFDIKKSTFGTIDEIVPLLYLIKQCVVDANLDAINLYGFSAGGGAIINALVVLKSSNYDEQLKKVGIIPEHKIKMLDAMQKGLIILDCPLKSMDEIFAMRQTPELEFLSERYAKNNMRPIDAISRLKGLRLTILLHFQNPDEMIGNRDDALYAERLKSANGGSTQVVIANEGGHNTHHASLWNAYKNIKK